MYLRYDVSYKSDEDVERNLTTFNQFGRLYKRCSKQEEKTKLYKVTGVPIILYGLSPLVLTGKIVSHKKATEMRFLSNVKESARSDTFRIYLGLLSLGVGTDLGLFSVTTELRSTGETG